VNSAVSDAKGAKIAEDAEKFKKTLAQRRQVKKRKDAKIFKEINLGDVNDHRCQDVCGFRGRRDAKRNAKEAKGKF